MAKTPQDVRQDNETLWSDFSGFHTRAQNFSDIVFARREYDELLPATLTQRVSMPSILARHEKENTQAALRRIYRRHYEPLGGLKREETSADKMEVASARNFNELDPSGNLLAGWYYSCSVEFGSVTLIEPREWVDPEQMPNEKDGDYDARRKRARERFFPYQALDKGQLNSAYSESNQIVNLAHFRYKLPLYEAIERFYGGHREKPEEMLRLVRQNMGDLKIDEAVPISGGGGMGQEIEIRLTVDHENFYYCWDHGGEYKGLGEMAYPHHFGGTPVLLIQGVYNYHEPLEFRREPILLPFVNAEDAKATMATLISSDAFTPVMPGRKMPAGITNIEDMPDAEYKQDPVTKLFLPVNTGGGYDPLVRPFSEQLKVLMEMKAEEARITSPQYDDGQAKSADTATQSAMQRDLYESRLASAQMSIVEGMKKIDKWLMHDMRYGLNKEGQEDGRKRGEGKSDTDWNMRFITTDKMYVIGRDVESKQEIEITPQDLDVDYEITIEPIDTRLSTQMTKIQTQRMIHEDGADLEESWLRAHGIENASQFVEDKNAETLFHAAESRWALVFDKDIADFLALRDTPPASPIEDPGMYEERLRVATDELLAVLNGGGVPPMAGQAPAADGGQTDAPYVQVRPVPADQPGAAGIESASAMV